MLDAICHSIKNYFEKEVHAGTFTVVGGELSLDFLLEGQYFRIVGSVLNDGVYKYPCNTLTDETFDGEVWAMVIPPTFIALAEEIKAYTEKGGSVGAYTSESYPNGYSYTRATDDGGVPITWQTAFASQLAKWRKI